MLKIAWLNDVIGDSGILFTHGETVHRYLFSYYAPTPRQGIKQ